MSLGFSLSFLDSFILKFYQKWTSHENFVCYLEHYFTLLLFFLYISYDKWIKTFYGFSLPNRSFVFSSQWRLMGFIHRIFYLIVHEKIFQLIFKGKMKVILLIFKFAFTDLASFNRLSNMVNSHVNERCDKKSTLKEQSFFCIWSIK